MRQYASVHPRLILKAWVSEQAKVNAMELSECHQRESFGAGMKRTRKVWESLSVRWKRRSKNKNKKIKKCGKKNKKPQQAATAESGSRQQQQTTAAHSKQAHSGFQVFYVCMCFMFSAAAAADNSSRQRQHTASKHTAGFQVFGFLGVRVFEFSGFRVCNGFSGVPDDRQAHSGFSSFQQGFFRVQKQGK
jgi:hypothetical protein